MSNVDGSMSDQRDSAGSGDDEMDFDRETLFDRCSSLNAVPFKSPDKKLQAELQGAFNFTEHEVAVDFSESHDKYVYNKLQGQKKGSGKWYKRSHRYYRQIEEEDVLEKISTGFCADLMTEFDREMETAKGKEAQNRWLNSKAALRKMLQGDRERRRVFNCIKVTSRSSIAFNRESELVVFREGIYDLVTLTLRPLKRGKHVHF